MLVKIISGSRIQNPKFADYFNLTASVQKVYKRRGLKKFDGSVNFLACDLPDSVLRNDRIRRNTRLLIMGTVMEHYGMVVDGNGYLEIRELESKRRGRVCKKIKI